jgi:hypothetical protein
MKSLGKLNSDQFALATKTDRRKFAGNLPETIATRIVSINSKVPKFFKIR